MRQLPATAAEDLLEVFHRRARSGANIVATNRPIEGFGKILHDNAAASAMLDRLMERIHLIAIKGRSYRIKQAKTSEEKLDPPSTET